MKFVFLWALLCSLSLSASANPFFFNQQFREFQPIPKKDMSWRNLFPLPEIEEVDFPQIGFEPFHSQVNRINSDHRGNIYFTGFTQLEEDSPRIMTVWKLLPNGMIDENFGDEGRFISPFIDQNNSFLSSQGYSLITSPEGDIYITGYILMESEQDHPIKNVAIWKISSAGELDEDFGIALTPGLYKSDIRNSLGKDIQYHPEGIFIIGSISIFEDHPQFERVLNDQDLLVLKLDEQGNLDINFSANDENLGFFRGDLLENRGPHIMMTSGLWLNFDDEERLLISGSLKIKHYQQPFPNNIQGFHTRFLQNGEIDLAYGPDGNGNIVLQDSNPYQIWDSMIEDTLIIAEGIYRFNNQGRIFQFDNLHPQTQPGIPFMMADDLYKVGNLSLNPVPRNLERSTDLVISKYNREGIPENNFNQEHGTHFYSFDSGYAEVVKSVTTDSQNNIWIAGRFYPELEEEEIPLRNTGTIGIWKLSSPNYDEVELIYMDKN